MMALMMDAAFMERRAVNLRAERVVVILHLHKPKDVLISATKDETTGDRLTSKDGPQPDSDPD